MTQHSQQEVPSEQNWPQRFPLSLGGTEQSQRAGSVFSALGQSQMGTDLPSPNSPARLESWPGCQARGAGSTAFTTTEPLHGQATPKPFGE